MSIFIATATGNWRVIDSIHPLVLLPAAAGIVAFCVRPDGLGVMNGSANNRGLIVQAVKFLLVGGVSFVVDAGMLALLVYQADVGYIAARLVSVALAVSVAFVLNAKFTFLVRVADARFLRYVLIQAIGASLNFGAYSALVLHGPLAGRPLLSLMCGAALSTINNFFLSRRYVYVDKERRLDKTVDGRQP